MNGKRRWPEVAQGGDTGIDGQGHIENGVHDYRDPDRPCFHPQPYQPGPCDRRGHNRDGNIQRRNPLALLCHLRLIQAGTDVPQSEEPGADPKGNRRKVKGDQAA